MKYFAAALLVACFIALASSQAVKPLSLETIDLENTLKNDKLVRRYIDCVLDKGRCDTNGKDLKGKRSCTTVTTIRLRNVIPLHAEMLPRVLNQNCSGCTPKQRENADRIIDFMKKNHAGEWTQINAKYSA